MVARTAEPLDELLVPLDILVRNEETKPVAQPIRQLPPINKLAEDPVNSNRKAAKQNTEQQESLAIISRHIDRYVENKDLPPAIARFIDTRWRFYTLRFCALADKDSDNWRKTLKTMNDLAWSVRPKKNEVSRRRLIEMIPVLYEQISFGLEFIAASQTEREAFFAALVDLHNAALNGQGGPGAPSPVDPDV